MKRFLYAAVPAMFFLATQSQAGNKPGLWEMRITKNIVDGQDHSAQMSSMNEQMQAAMAKMSPQQRAQMAAMMGNSGVGIGMGGPGGQGGMQMCITPEMAKQDVPVADKNSGCPPANVQKNGNHVSYGFSCTKNGETTSGKGEATINGDTVSVSSDVTTTSAHGTHHIQTESEMRFIKSDCGNVKPLGGTRLPAADRLKGGAKE